jgi:hypothetical protein
MVTAAKAGAPFHKWATQLDVAVGRTGKASSDMLMSAELLHDQARQLTAAAEKFLTELRAA